MIFKDANAAGLEPDARLTAMWLWTVGGGSPNGTGTKSSDAESEDADNSAGTRKGTNMHWEERIEINPDVLVGKPIIRGTRIAVEFVVDLLARGWSMEQILQEYDHLTRADIMACLGYASDTLKSERVYLVPR